MSVVIRPTLSSINIPAFLSCQNNRVPDRIDSDDLGLAVGGLGGEWRSLPAPAIMPCPVSCYFGMLGGEAAVT